MIGCLMLGNQCKTIVSQIRAAFGKWGVLLFLRGAAFMGDKRRCAMIHFCKKSDRFFNGCGEAASLGRKWV